MTGWLYLVSGLSGAGRSTALKMLEDMGCQAIDNLPLYLADALITHYVSQPGQPPLALGIDLRSHDFSGQRVDDLRQRALQLGINQTQLIFLTCDDNILVQRFNETRRRHPLATDRPIIDGLAIERRLMEPIKQQADDIIDTSGLTIGELKERLAILCRHAPFAAAQGMAHNSQSAGPLVFLHSFAYRHGLPREADVVIDARFLRNPHYDPLLRPLTGLDPKVGALITSDPDYTAFFTGLTQLIDLTLPRQRKEGKSYITIAIGCSGGRHRSVWIAEALTRHIRDKGYTAQCRHRELARLGLVSLGESKTKPPA